jgi:hypothetical protein
MPAVVLLDQRMSRRDPDRVEAWRENANEKYASELTLPFVRTAGDEMQAVTSSSTALVGVIQDAVIDRGWWIGIGIGDVERPLGATSRESRGEAFWLARGALEKAKAQRASRPLVLRAQPPERLDELVACLHAYVFIVLRRTKRQAEAAEAVRAGRSVSEIAGQRSVTVQAVYEVLQAAGTEEEAELGRLAVQLASPALA